MALYGDGRLGNAEENMRVTSVATSHGELIKWQSAIWADQKSGLGQMTKQNHSQRREPRWSSLLFTLLCHGAIKNGLAQMTKPNQRWSSLLFTIACAKVSSKKCPWAHHDQTKPWVSPQASTLDWTLTLQCICSNVQLDLYFSEPPMSASITCLSFLPAGIASNMFCWVCPSSGLPQQMQNESLYNDTHYVTQMWRICPLEKW